MLNTGFKHYTNRPEGRARRAPPRARVHVRWAPPHVRAHRALARVRVKCSLARVGRRLARARWAQLLG